MKPTIVEFRFFLISTPISGAVAPAIGATIYRPHSWAHSYFVLVL